MPEHEYRINPKGIDHYNKKYKGNHCSLPVQLLISHLIERHPNPCGEDDGWVTLAEVEKFTVNAYAILEEWRGYGEIDRRPIKKSDIA